jgi:phage terminase small subunit
MPSSLTHQQMLFVNEYIKDGNAKRSAISAGYSVKSAESIGSRLVKNTQVAAELARRRLPIEKKSQLSAEKVFEALNNLVEFDPGQCFDAEGKLLPINQIPLEARKALTAIDATKGSIKHSSRLGSLELAAKLLGMVKEQQTQQTAVSITIAAPPELPKPDPNRPQLLPEW